MESAEAPVYFLVLATDGPGLARIRTETRPSHRAYLRNPGPHAVRVHLGGPTLTTDGNEMNGTLLVVEAQSLEDVTEFVADDPYSRAGLFASVVVRPWSWTLGAPESRP